MRRFTSTAPARGAQLTCNTSYRESLAVKYNLENARLYDTPMKANLKLEQTNKTDETIKYRNLIGELLYISTGTRPDITYSVNYLSRFQSCYDSTHFKYAMRILKRSYTYKPFCPKLPKKMIKNIIIIKLFKYIVNITYFE